MSRTRFTVSGGGGGPGWNWQTIQEDDWTSYPVTTFNADGLYILGSNRWYKENTAAETFPPHIVAGVGLRFEPNNVGDIIGRANGLLSTRFVELGLGLANDVPLRLSMMMAGNNNPSANALYANCALEVSPPGGRAPQQHCWWGRMGANGPFAWPGVIHDWTVGNVYNNSGGVILGDTTAPLIACNCIRLTMMAGQVAGMFKSELGIGIGGAWPAETLWCNRVLGADWGGNLSFAQTYADVMARGTFGAWGLCLTAFRGFVADPNAYVVIAKTKLEVAYR
jgi:hypothetical protein